MKRAPPYSRAKFFAKKRRSRIYFPTSGRANIWTESHEVYVAMTDASSPVVEKITGHMFTRLGSDRIRLDYLSETGGMCGCPWDAIKDEDSSSPDRSVTG